MVLCVCGERIQVPRSALGKTGLCPACGRVISITADAASPVRAQSMIASPPVQAGRPIAEAWGTGAPRIGAGPAAEAKRRFAEAVDLYFSRRYAQALSIFQVLAEEFPDNEDIRTGRDMCITALHTQPQTGIDSHAVDGADASSDNGRAGARLRGQLALPAPGEPITEIMVEETLKRVLIEKMLSGSSDEVQLRAAELAVQVFGIGRQAGGKAAGDGAPEAQPDPPEDVYIDPDASGRISE